MSTKKIKLLTFILLLMSIFIFSLWLTLPVWKVLTFGVNIDNRMFLNKKICKINPEKIKKVLMKDEEIKYVRILRSPFGILFIFVEKREPVAYFCEDGEVKGVDENGNIFKIKVVNKSLKFIKGNKEKIIEGLYLMKLRDADTIYLCNECPITIEDGFKIIWGNGDYRKKDKIARRIKKNLEKKCVIDLRFKNNIFINKEDLWLN